MASESLISSAVDPLSDWNMPNLFSRTIRASIDGPVVAASKDLDSVHGLMKSRVLRSPEKLRNEAKDIVERAKELIDSNPTKFPENVKNHAITKKDKEKPQERRQGLGLNRKRNPFALKARFSQPSVNLEPTLNIKQLQDPDDFFDAYERLENAKKEIRKQLGGGVDNLNEVKPSNNTRIRRPGILGKSYSYKHRFSSDPCEIDNLMPSHETIEQDSPSAPKDDSLQSSFDPDPNTVVDLEGVELADTKNKTEESEVDPMLEELLSFNDEDLDGDGALNILQKKLKIQPLDLEKLKMPEFDDIPRTKISTRKNSLVTDSSMISIDGVEHEEMAQNPIHLLSSSPTPPRIPYSSLSSLKKKTLQLDPLRDPLSPLNVDISARQNSSVSSQHIEITEPTRFDMETHKALESESAIPDQFGDENNTEELSSGPLSPLNIDISARRTSASSSQHIEITEPTKTDMEAHKLLESESVLPDQFGDENNTEEATNVENMNEPKSNPSVLEDDATDAPPSKQTEPEKQPEVRQPKLQKRKREAGDNHLRKAHPLRKSLADCGTSFESGVRRSKRIKTRRLQYWKGERFLYSRVDDSLKLLGLKYISPGKDSNLKVKPYVPLNLSKYKEALEFAALH